jgi:hypothetical protein
MKMLRTRRKGMTKPPRRWGMTVTAKDDRGHRLVNGMWEVNLAIMLSRGGRRETRAERRS